MLLMVAKMYELRKNIRLLLTDVGVARKHITLIEKWITKFYRELEQEKNGL